MKTPSSVHIEQFVKHLLAFAVMYQYLTFEKWIVHLKPLSSDEQESFFSFKMSVFCGH